jgi:glycosyltransferase involved in cell wall biosynthesis
VVDLPLGRLSLSTLYRRQKRRLGEIVERFRPDVVHGQGTDVAGFLAVASGLPSVITVHGLLAECARYQTEFRMKARALLVAALTERHTIRRATDLIAISPYVKRYYQDDIRGRIHDIPNAVGPRFFGIERNPERGRILYAGRIAHGKGLPELIQAVAKSREAIEKLVLAGAAPDRSYEAMLRAKAARLGVAGKVVFAGLLDETSLLREFALAEALVLPSHQETAPMVVQQAMASGLPVVATTVGGIPDQIENEATGLLFEAGNVERLAGHLGPTHKRSEIRSNARNRRPPKG